MNGSFKHFFPVLISYNIYQAIKDWIARIDVAGKKKDYLLYNVKAGSGRFSIMDAVWVKLIKEL
jgi:hypothetical protein